MGYSACLGVGFVIKETGYRSI